MNRILIDNGNSADVIFLDVLEEMQALNTNIVTKTTKLIGFNGEQKTILGKDTLLVYAEGINLHTKFAVLGFPFAYNIILGYP